MSATFDLDGSLLLTFKINDKDILEHIGELKDNLLSLEFKPYRQKRSIDANGLFWACIGDVSRVSGISKWDLYLQILKESGQFTYITVKPKAVEKMKQMWREIEEVGEMPNGDIQLLCYFGSSTYDSKEFSYLIDNVIEKMKEWGLQPPLPRHIQEALKRWEKNTN